MKKNLLFLSAILLIQFTATSQNIPTPSLVKANQAIPKEVVRATREFRERLMADPYRPAYHFAFPEDNGRPGDPNGAFFANGRYHLMYLYNREGFGFSWGHVSSTDLLHWRHHPDAIIPGNGDEGCFSGGAFENTCSRHDFCRFNWSSVHLSGYDWWWFIVGFRKN